MRWILALALLVVCGPAFAVEYRGYMKGAKTLFIFYDVSEDKNCHFTGDEVHTAVMYPLGSSTLTISDTPTADILYYINVNIIDTTVRCVANVTAQATSINNTKTGLNPTERRFSLNLWDNGKIIAPQYS